MIGSLSKYALIALPIVLAVFGGVFFALKRRGQTILSNPTVSKALTLLKRRLPESQRATLQAALDRVQQTATGKAAAADPKASATAEANAALPPEIARIFDAEVARLRHSISDRDSLYQIPWCLVAGPPHSGQSAIIENAELYTPIGDSASSEADKKSGARWHFLEHGVVIDLEGRAFLDDEIFEAVLTQLRTARPRRPIDSLLLIVPLSLLINAHREEEAVKQLGAKLYERLQRLQRELRLLVPVYVLISQCDLLPGFVTLSQALLASQRKQLIGWSSPHAPTASYAPDWITQALSAISIQINQLLFDVLTTSSFASPERDALFALPREVARLATSLHTVIDQVFRANVYSEPTLLRGIYLAGDIAPPTLPGASDKVPHPGFVNHLFAKKIFSEYGMARPLRSGLISARQAVLGVKAAVPLALFTSLFTLWSERGRVQSDTSAVYDYLDKIPRTDSVEDSVLPERERYAKRTEKLLQALANVPPGGLRRATLPTSFTSSLDEDVWNLIRDSFETVILRGLEYGLKQKAEVLFGSVQRPDRAALPDGVDSNEPPPAGEIDPRAARSVTHARPTTLPKAMALVDMPEYQSLRQLAAGYAEFTHYVDAYNRLASEPRKRLETVGPLVKYVFKIDISEDFLHRRRFYEEALATTTSRRIDVSEFGPRVRVRADELCQELRLRLFEENPLDIGQEILLRHLNRLRAENDSGIADLPSLIALRDGVAQLEQDLKRPELAWVAAQKLELGEAYRDLLAALRGFGGSERFVDGIETEWQAAHTNLRARLESYQLPRFGGIIVRDADSKRLALAPALRTTQAILDAFVKQPFVELGTERQPFSTPDGAYRVSWNEESLRQAVQLADAYTAFVRDRLGQVPELLREVVRSTALERLGNSMPNLIGQARRADRITVSMSDPQVLQDILNVEVADLRRATSTLRQILEVFDRLHLKVQHADLYGQLEEDSREIVLRLDSILERADLYRVSSKLASWRGPRPPALAAYDVEDAEGLSEYLKSQRGRVRTLARDFAKPTLALLDGVTPPSGGALTDVLLGKWRTIVTEVDRFDLLVPGNSLRELESFIDSTLMAITVENCREKLPGRGSDSRDYFLLGRARVYDAVRRRCGQLAEEQILDAYGEVALAYNRTLAGRFPFTREPAAPDEDALPRDVRTFYELFDRFLIRYDALLTKLDTPTLPALAAAQRDIAGFVESMRALRPFFAPLLADKSEALPRYGLGVSYRVNRQAEINGNQIAEWSLEIGGQKIDDTQATWQIGDKVRIGLRWAKDGLYQPSLKEQVRGASLDGSDRVVFEWGGLWALVRFLRIYRSQPGDLRKAVDRQPHILKLPVELAERKPDGQLHVLPDSYYKGKDAAAGTSARGAFIFNRAVVFVRFALTPPESREPIVIPADFPSRAPTVHGAENGR